MKIEAIEKITVPDRSGVTNKGDCGRLLVVGGDVGMAGAPVFAAKAAYRSGTGLVEILTHSENRIPVQILLPEAVTSFWDAPRDVSIYSAISIGMGMGKSGEARKLLYRILSLAKCPVVIDADGLNILSDTPELYDFVGNNTVLTPHLGEFSRLTGKSIEEISEDTAGNAAEFCKKHNTNIILKSNVSYIALADGSVFVNKTGDSTLSKGGSGDILAGLVGSFLAQGSTVEKAMTSASFILGKAGERVGERLGQHGALARDITDEIPFVIK